MIHLTAFIRCKPGAADAFVKAFLVVGDFVRANEPDTLSYCVSRASDDPDLFVTQERFTDRAAMDAHNNGGGTQGFLAATQGMIADIKIHVGDEVLAV